MERVTTHSATQFFHKTEIHRTCFKEVTYFIATQEKEPTVQSN